jgi:predicted kinase
VVELLKLIVLVGLPRSGKTTWAREQGQPIVNPDSIRLALHGQRFAAIAEPFVWAIAYLMVSALFLAGHTTVIVDATNVSKKRRDEWFTRFHTPNCDVELHVVETSPAECMRRAVELEDTEILPVIARMEAEWDLPKPAGWSESGPQK